MDHEPMDNKQRSSISRRNALKLSGKAVVSGALACVAPSASMAGYGSCAKCSCVGFTADYRNVYVCSNCGHAYADHW